MRGSVYKRCGCPVEHDARGRRKACRLAHGSWCYIADLGPGPSAEGVWTLRRQVRRGGFPTRKDAESALAAVIDGVADGTSAHDERLTVAVFLRSWLDAKVANGLRPSTATSYRQHVQTHLVPFLGELRLRDLRQSHVEALLAHLSASAANGRGPGPSTIRRIHATLRSALSTAKRRRLVSFNAAVDVDLPSAPRPRVHPWEPTELGAFLDHVAGDRLGVLFEVMAATGLRRGEVLGLRWVDVDVERAVIVVRQQLVHLPGGGSVDCPVCGGSHRGVGFGLPKSASGEHRVVDLDRASLGALLGHRLRQDAERATWADAYCDHGLVFAREDGAPLHPTTVSHRFTQLVATSGVRAVRLHDLRHGQASLMLAAGVPIALVSKRLGHSSIALTPDTYSHLLEGVGRDAAERAASLVPRRARTEQDRDHPVTTATGGAAGGDPVEPLTSSAAAPPAGFEPATVGLEVRCSIR